MKPGIKRAGFGFRLGVSVIARFMVSSRKPEPRMPVAESTRISFMCVRPVKEITLRTATVLPGAARQGRRS
jgi:hypothetical protein